MLSGFARRCLLVCCATTLATLAAAEPPPGEEDGQAADAIVGNWLVDSRDAVVQIDKAGAEYQGRLVWLKEPNFGPEDGPELNGKPATDTANPDPAQRSRPLLGLRMLWGLHYQAHKQAWEDGRVYNTDNGQIYHCHVWMHDKDRLKLRGYVGIPLLGETTTWTRTELPPPAAALAPQGH
jgi:uncharacterized protein (DUF2147 family)